MKQLAITLEPFHLEPVKSALIAIGVSGMTVHIVHEHSPRLERVDSFRGSQYTIDSMPAVIVEVVLDDFKVEQAVHAVRKATRSQECHGTISVAPVAEVIRVRTGERGSSAL